MKSSTKRRTLLAVLMAMVMSLAMAGTAFAATITISDDQDAKATVDGHTYGAYQIFKGEMQDGQLTNIVWGASVTDDSALLDELNQNIEFTKGANLATAVDVAHALDGVTNNAPVAQWFADTVAKYLDKKGEAPYRETSGSNGEAVFDNIDDGYYLIRDTQKVEEGQTATDFMLKVAGRDEQVVPKAGSTESDKTVLEDSTEQWQEYADAEINQVVPFKLTSTVPANIANYKNYWVEFQDTLSEGLTLDKDSIAVSVNGKTLVQGTDYILDVTPGPNGDGGEYFTIKLDADKGGKLPSVTLNAGDTIEVNYRVTVNENAVVGVEGNPNKFKTVYETNPNKDKGGEPEPGETPEEVVFVFTWELDNTKIDGATRDTLADATFVLSRESDDKQAQLKAINANTYVIEAWVDGAGTEMKTYEDGIFNIKGLDSEDVYYLTETKAPDGYNELPEPIRIQIGTKGAIAANQKPTTITFTKSGGGAGEANVENTEGVFKQDIVNMSGSTLPSTGGMGTVIFTVVGVAVMVVAAIALITRRRKNASLS